jgi:hypothetical protein
MKHEVGDTVRIRSKEWIDAQKKGLCGEIRNPDDDAREYEFIPVMFVYAGNLAKITSIITDIYRIDVDGESWDWEDWMFDPDYNAGEPLSPEDAIRVMLDGEVLVDKNEHIYWYERNSRCFYYKYEGMKSAPKCEVEKCPENLYLRPTKRAMTRWELLAWAGSKASRGWVVRILGDSDIDWVPPQCFAYNSNTARYQRARLLPDGSGIDEDSICGFEVEE